MEEKTTLPWEQERCEYKDEAGRCTGIRVGNDGNCLAHTTSDQRDLALAMLRAGADCNFARGVPLSEELVEEILQRAPTVDGRRVLTSADFGLATFTGAAGFHDAIFSGAASFDRANFEDDAWFDGATFTGAAWFEHAMFGREARFSGTTFTGAAWFGKATFADDADFDGASFRQYAGFGDTTFTGAAGFNRSSFGENVSFERATFIGSANFAAATFSAEASFERAAFTAMFGGDAFFRAANFMGVVSFRYATLRCDADFTSATFTEARKLGPLVVVGNLIFDDAVFSVDIDIECAAKALSCKKTRFRDEVNVRARWAELILEDADFASACMVDRAPSAFDGSAESELSDPRNPEGRPRVISVRRTNVANLVLADVDLRPCRFAGALKLDGLRVQSNRQFAERPRGWHNQLGWPPVWKWTTRRVIAEEHEWRQKYESDIRRKGWYPEECMPRFAEVASLLGSRSKSDAAADIQEIYRDLRKGREDRRDEPGAAHFYYGEMEMRRAGSPASFEKLVLWLYWLVSGYGLRASRALVALASTVLLCSVAIDLWGVPRGDDRGFAEIVVFGMQSTTSLLRPPDVTLTLPGQVIQIVLRLLGPLFFGLALLSLRGRVKR